MVKSILGFAFVWSAFAADATCGDDAMSALQHSKTRQVKAHSDMYDRLADVLEQVSVGAPQVCLSVREGEEAPVMGVFSSDNGVMEVARGYVAESPGRFCADAAVVSLLQRSLGAETMAGMEQTLAKKGVDGATGGKKSSRSGKDYGVLSKCTGHNPGNTCGGENTYGCTKAKIERMCGSLANACCDDGDGSCEDGDDHVECIKDASVNSVSCVNGKCIKCSNGKCLHDDGSEVQPPAYGTLSMCGHRELETHGGFTTVICGGRSNQYECTEALIVKACGTMSMACCSDSDGSCADGDDHVSCLQKEFHR